MTDPNKPNQNVSEDDWADAMSEQEETPSDAASEEDPWAAAMAEQEAAEESDEDREEASAASE